MAGLLDSSGRIPVAGHRWCVYALWDGPQIVYVGYTNQLERRLGQHLGADKKSPLVLGGGFESCTHVFCDSKKEALTLERATIAELTPIYNTQVIRERAHA